jgi:hypothetical protein
VREDRVDAEEKKRLLRTRIALSIFGALALVLIVSAVWLPPLMREMAVDACADAGGRYDREQALCVRG